jgi:hypothetical protein
MWAFLCFLFTFAHCIPEIVDSVGFGDSAQHFRTLAKYAGAACTFLIYDLDCDKIFINRTYECGYSCQGDAAGTVFGEAVYDYATSSAGFTIPNVD